MKSQRDVAGKRVLFCFRRNHSSSDAELIFENAFENGLLASKWQRFSINEGFHVRGLKSKPIWDVSETGKFRNLLK